MRLRRLTTPAALLAAAALTLTACGGEADVEGEGEATGTGTGTEAEATADETAEGTAEFSTITEGTLTVCTDAPYPPMEFEQDGEFTGYDIELVRAVAQAMGLDGIEVINSGFDPITSGAVFQDPQQCDVAAASITITEERDESVDFSDAYFDADQSLLVKVDAGVGSLDELAGERIGVQSGTTGEAYAQENTPEGAEIVSYDNPGDIFVALEAAEIQGVLQDLVVNQGRTLEDDTVEVVETFPTDEQYGFAFAEEGSDDLQEAFNAALQELVDDGTVDSLREEWFPEGGGQE